MFAIFVLQFYGTSRNLVVVTRLVLGIADYCRGTLQVSAFPPNDRVDIEISRTMTHTCHELCGRISLISMLPLEY